MENHIIESKFQSSILMDKRVFTTEKYVMCMTLTTISS